MLADLRGLQLLNEIGVASCAAAAAWRGRDLPLRPPSAGPLRHGSHHPGGNRLMTERRRVVTETCIWSEHEGGLQRGPKHTPLVTEMVAQIIWMMRLTDISMAW